MTRNKITPAIAVTALLVAVFGTTPLGHAAVQRIEGISKLETVTAVYPSTNGMAAGFVNCPEGKRAIAGAARTNSPNDGTMVQSFPTYEATWWGKAKNPDPNASYTLTVYAICAKGN